MCKKPSIASSLAIATVLLTVLGTATYTAAQQETALASFNSNGAGGEAPYGGLVFDQSGNLFGTTSYGGNGPCATQNTTGCGTVFELSPKAGGGWTKKVIHVFSGDNGNYPNAGLIFDGAGNLYGTTVYGGTGVCSAVAPTGCGVVFELLLTAKGTWTEKVLHDFGSGEDGPYPGGGVVFDAAGNLYGVTTGIVGSCTHTPSANCGAVFELTPRASGPWKENVLHFFRFDGTDGYAPSGNLILDKGGNLYGGTYWGGTYYNGTAFKLIRNANGGWTERILYEFYWGKGVSGGGPSGLTFDALGNLYGSTAVGGDADWGAVYELLPSASGTWTLTILHSFNAAGFTDGGTPNGGLIFDSNGYLYGTTRYGGNGAFWCITWGGGNEAASCGTVFRLVQVASGNWSETILHNFGNGIDGLIPNAGVIKDADGNLYGTTSLGGAARGGMVFEVTP